MADKTLSEMASAMGKLGGKANVKKHGKSHMARIGRRSWISRNAKRDELEKAT